MEQKKSWFFRPVAWICTILMILALQYVAELICQLGAFLTVWLGGLSTIMVVILVLLFGSVFCGLFFYSAVILPQLLVSLSDKIYPSNHAFRYYFVGLYEIAGCAFLIYSAAIGAVSGGSMFWFYARYVWLILACAIMMVSGHGAAKERHQTNEAPIAPATSNRPDANSSKRQKIKDDIAKLNTDLKEHDEAYIKNKQIFDEAFSDEDLRQMVSKGQFPADQVDEYVEQREALAMYIRGCPAIRNTLVGLINDLTKELAELDRQE